MVKKGEKMNRRPFKEIYGYKREDETSEQLVKRLMTRRLEQLQKIGGAVAKLGSNPYKPSDTQRAYAAEIASEVYEQIENAMTQTTNEGKKVEVPE